MRALCKPPFRKHDESLVCSSTSFSFSQPGGGNGLFQVITLLFSIFDFSVDKVLKTNMNSVAV